ncbi:MAG: hypothetical protein ABI779_24120 [Acidobacteriota bacterium]
MLALVMGALLSAQTQTAQTQETITVSRVLVDTRVTRFGGEPVLGLTAADFDVRIGGSRAVIESVEWVEERSDTPDQTGETSRDRVDEDAGDLPRDPSLRPHGRLIVFFVQTDFSRESARIEGQMNFLPYARELARSLSPRDRAAVFSFDSHLKFRLDFSNDAEAISEALNETLWIDQPAPPPLVAEPSLAPRLDREQMFRAAHAEKALALVAGALEPIPGPKTLLLLGWGLGELTPAGVQMKWQWKEARAALEAARVSIFSLDTTYADAHDLQVGLQTAAAQTGGFYAKTHIFPRIALQRLQRTLGGHYELELRTTEELPAGAYALRIRVKRRGVTVLAPTSVMIRP